MHQLNKTSASKNEQTFENSPAFLIAGFCFFVFVYCAYNIYEQFESGGADEVFGKIDEYSKYPDSEVAILSMIETYPVMGVLSLIGLIIFGWMSRNYLKRLMLLFKTK